MERIGQNQRRRVRFVEFGVDEVAVYDCRLVAYLYCIIFSYQPTTSCLSDARVCVVERQLAGAVHVGTVQGAVSHAVYRVWSLSASEYDRRLADDRQHVDRRHVLRAVRRTHHHRHTVLRHVQTTLSREGTEICSVLIGVENDLGCACVSIIKLS